MPGSMTRRPWRQSQAVAAGAAQWHVGSVIYVRYVSVDEWIRVTGECQVLRPALQSQHIASNVPATAKAPDLVRQTLGIHLWERLGVASKVKPSPPVLAAGASTSDTTRQHGPVSDTDPCVPC